MKAIVDRFLSAESELLSAFTTSSSLTSFDETWTALVADFSTAKASQQLDQHTISLAHTVASRISIIASTLLSLDIESLEECRTFEARCVKILTDGDTEEAQTSVKQLAGKIPPSPFPSVTDSTPATPLSSLDSVASIWLLENLHDPYPSADAKAYMASLCGDSVKHVQEWFADARQRIGWTALSREIYGGSRHETSKAARLAYAEDRGGGDVPFEIGRAFTAIKVSAHRIWPSQPCVSVAMFTESEEEDTTPPPPIAGCKRRLDISTDSIEQGLEGTSLSARPSKRRRDTSSGLPYFPPSSRGEPSSQHIGAAEHAVLEQYDAHRPRHMTNPPLRESSQLHSGELRVSKPVIDTVSTPDSMIPESFCTASHVSYTRKRRLSDPALPGLPKRPRGQITSARKQAVSDPLPTNIDLSSVEPFSVEHWLQSDFNVSNTLQMNGWDPSTLDVDLAALVVGQSEEATSPSSPDTSTMPSFINFDVPDATIASATQEGFDFSTFDLVDNSVGGYDLQAFLDHMSSGQSSTSLSPSSAASSTDLPDHGFVEHPSAADWSNFEGYLSSLSSSPSSSESSLSNDASPFQATLVNIPLSGQGDITYPLFGVDPSFNPSDLLSDIDGFSTLHMPLEATV